MENVKKLKMYLKKEMSSIPDFIDTKSSIDREIWAILDIIGKIIGTLFTDICLSNKKIQQLIIQTVECLTLIQSYINEDDLKEIMISQYILDILERYLETAEEMELYEACSNINNYKNLYLCI